MRQWLKAWLLLALLGPGVASAAPSYYGWGAGAFLQGPEVGGDVTPPTVDVISVAANGTDVTIAFSEAVQIGANGAGTHTMVMSGGNTTWTYASGDGTASFVGTAGRTIGAGETGTMTYAAGGADRLEDLAGNDMVNYFGETITNNSTQDGVAPLFVSAVINAAGDELAVTFDEDVTQGAGYADGDWAATATDGALTFVYASGDTTDTHVLTPSRVIGSHEVVTLDWAGTANGLEDGSGNDLAAFADEPVTNNSTTDTVAPTVTAARINGTVYRLTFSEAVVHGAGGTGGHALTCSGGAVTVSSFDSGAGTVLFSYTLSREIADDETCTRAYTNPASDGIQDAAGNILANYAGQAVTVQGSDNCPNVIQLQTKQPTQPATRLPLCA